MGRAGIQRYFAESGDTWEEDRLVLAEELYDLDGRVLFLGHAVARGLGSGVPVEMPLAFIVEFREGRLARASTYLSHDQARVAAGIEG